ncbi:MAG TPA: type II secretion system minor pseudopilin GspK [Candidatus Binatia bacterium]
MSARRRLRRIFGDRGVGVRGTGVRDERGMALLAALFAVALLTVIVVEMTDATLVHTHLTRNAGNAMAAQLLARSAEVAGEALITSDDTNDPDVTCPNGLWAAPIIGVPVGPGVVGLQITDEGGKLDLNAVGDARYRAAVQELFSLLGLDPDLVDRIAAWIASPSSGSPMATGEASDYCALPMPCEPRQRPMSTLEELLLIRGFDEQTLRVLRPYVTVIPRTEQQRSSGPLQPVNLNTADWRVLRALGCDVGESDAPPACPSFPTDEQEQTWRNEVEEWKKQKCAGARREWLGTKSNLYSIRASGTVGDVTQVLRTTVQRSGGRARRLWWQERPVADVMPVEIS